MATRKRDRFFALFGAILFLTTSSALTVAVVLTLINDHSNNATTDPTSSTKETTKLQGTQLANFTPITDVPKLETVDTKVGTGTEAKAGDTVTVDYTGAVAATGVIFQSSLDTGQPVSFPLNQVIAGWSQGIPGMKIGGERRLVIPADLAYGANPPSGSGIPANAPLVFDVTLHSIGQ